MTSLAIQNRRRRARIVRDLANERWEITPAGRAALEAFPPCSVDGDESAGEAYVTRDIGSHWLPVCAAHLEEAERLGYVVRRWPA